MAEDKCFICTASLLENDKTMEYECGCHVVHTSCGIRRAYQDVLDGGLFSCTTCNTVFLYGTHVDNYTAASAETPENTIIEELKKDKVFKACLKNVRAKRALRNKASKEFIKKCKEEYEKFKTATEINIQSIKLSQNESRKALMDTEEFKAAKKTDLGYMISINRFIAKYNLGRSERIAFKLDGRRWGWRWRRSRPTNMIKWRFRIRI
jgi:hypothetical protein